MDLSNKKKSGVLHFHCRISVRVLIFVYCIYGVRREVGVALKEEFVRDVLEAETCQIARSLKL